MSANACLPTLPLSSSTAPLTPSRTSALAAAAPRHLVEVKRFLAAAVLAVVCLPQLLQIVLRWSAHSSCGDER